MRVIVPCEFSGIVRNAFNRRGHYAMSNDLLESESSGDHYQGDIRDLLSNPTLGNDWDLLIAFPPCTRLASSGARWWRGREQEQHEAVEFARLLMDAPVKSVAVENPIGVLSTRIRKPDQIIHPWQFWAGEPGKGEVKATCLWLKNLPLLIPTTPNEKGRIARVHREPPSPDRWKARSRTPLGIAEAMAEQWGTT